MCRIICLSIMFAMVLASSAFAGDDNVGKLSLTDGITMKESTKSVSKDTQEDLKESLRESRAKIDKEEKKKGFFSFLNFSFFKDEVEETPQNTESDEDYLTRMYRLAEEGDLDALMSLGYMSLYGLKGVEVNYKKAFEYYDLAAQSGDDIAINNLGSLYYSGVGVRKDIDKAAELFAQASDLGNTEATLNLAVIFLTQSGYLDNKREAVNLLKKVAEQNNPTGRYLLGYAYLKGIGVPENRKKAIDHIRYAAEQNYDEAQYMMGYMYEHGLGVPQNYNNALRYFTRAYNQGNLSATHELGELYAHGNRIESDYYKAHIMYNLASYYGVPQADKKRDFIASSKLKPAEVLQAQTEAENFKAEPSPLTSYIRSTFGESLALYVDKNAPIIKAEKE